MPSEIHVLYTQLSRASDPHRFEYYLQQIPLKFQLPIMQYKKREDVERTLFGKLLLRKALKRLDKVSFSLDDIIYSSHQRPYFNSNFDFNISHSGDYVVCAISEHSKVGIDIEQIKEIDFLAYENFFTEEEVNTIRINPSKMEAFYNIWTKKEAFIKAVGEGLNIPLKTIDSERNEIYFKNNFWYWKKLDIDPLYSCHLCLQVLDPVIRMEEVLFE